MEQKFKPAETAILIDAEFLEFITRDFKKNFERILRRELNRIDLSELLTCLALDGGLTPGEREINVFFTYDGASAKFSVCEPSSLPDGLNGKAFRNQLGEFSCFCYSNGQFVNAEEMFLDSLQIIVDAPEVKRLLVVGFNERYGDRTEEILKAAKGKNIVQFRMDRPTEKQAFRHEIIAYPIMKALGIRGDELQ